jgi:glycosyltransferase involved in cell wall biosynthesis
VIKVVVIFPGNDSLGGMTSVAKEHIKSLRDSHFKVTEIGTTSSLSILQKLYNGFFAFFHLLVVLLLDRPNLASVHYASRSSFFRKSLFVIMLKLFRVKTALHLHGGGFIDFYESSSKFVKWYIKKILNLASSHYVLGATWRDFFRKELSIVSVEILPNSFVFCNSETELNFQRDIDVLFVGRVEQSKGVFDLVSAVEKIGSHINTVFVGRVLEQGISGVQLVGELSRQETLAYIRRAKILCLPSYVEAFPVVLLEAINCGALVVCSNVGAVSDILGCDYQYMFAPGDIDRLSLILSEVLADYEFSIESVMPRYIDCKQRYNTRTVSRKLIEQYTTIVS